MRARRTITVDVPAGIEDGMRIRLTGQGEVGPGGGPAGDLYIEIAELQHEVFIREGADLHCTVAVPMTAAALGTDLVLTTLDAEEKLEIRPGTQSGQVLTLRGKGVPRLRSSARGDLHVHVEVRTPTKLDEDAGAAAARLRRAAQRRGLGRHLAQRAVREDARRARPMTLALLPASISCRPGDTVVLDGDEGRHAPGEAAAGRASRSRSGTAAARWPAATVRARRARPVELAVDWRRSRRRPPIRGSSWCRPCRRASGPSWRSSC